MNAALQGYLAAVEESLAEAGTLERAGAELAAVSELVDGHAELSLAVNDGSVPVPARRAVLDDLLEGKVLPEVRRLVHQAVTVVPAAEVVNSFHWLANRVQADAARHGDGAEAPEAVTEAEPLLGRLGSRHRVSGYAAAVLETMPTGELEDVEDELFRFARTVEANPALRRALGDRDLPADLRQAVLADLLGGPRPPGHPAVGRPTPCGAAGPGTSSPPSTGWSRRRRGPAAGGWPGCGRPTRWTRAAAGSWARPSAG